MGKTLRLTETRGSRSWPAAVHASRNTLDLLGLQAVEGHPGVLREQGRAHEVHALLGRPLGSGAGAGTPPDAVAQAGRVRLDAQQAGRVGEHRSRVRLGEAPPGQDVEEDLRVLPGHAGVVAVVRLVAEVAEAVDRPARVTHG